MLIDTTNDIPGWEIQRVYCDSDSRNPHSRKHNRISSRRRTGVS